MNNSLVTRWIALALLCALCAVFIACDADDNDDDDTTADDDTDDDDAGDDDDDDDTADDYWRFITDDQGRALILHGINISNRSKWDPERLPWIERNDALRLSEDWGFNFVRYLILWDGVEPEPGAYNDEYLDAIGERLDWLHEAGIMVVLDMHQDLWGQVLGGDGAPYWATITDGWPHIDFEGHWALNYISPAVIRAFDNFFAYDRHPELQDLYMAMWVHVVERLGDHPAVLGYEPMNEPYPGSDMLDMLGWDETKYQDFLERFIAAVRSVDLDGWIFYEPRAAGGSIGWPINIGEMGDPREGENRLAYFPHLYPLMLDMNGYYDPAFDGTLEPWAYNRWVEAERQHAPLLCGEWSMSDRLGDVENLRLYLEKALAMLDYIGSGWAYWSYDPGASMGIIYNDGNERPAADILCRTYARRVAGWPTLHFYDAGSRTLTLEFTQREGVSGPTEIYIPESRHYAEGWEIEVSDPEGSWSMDWDDEREILSISTNPEQAEHTITIGPDL